MLQLAFWRVIALAAGIAWPMTVVAEPMGLGSTSPPQASPQFATVPATPATQPTAELDKSKTSTEIEKLKNEIVKLTQETSFLGRLSNAAGALVPILLWVLGSSVKRSYERNQQQSRDAAKKRHNERLARDQELVREQHNLKLFSDLAHDNPRTQVAAAIVLLERLTELREIAIPAARRGTEPGSGLTKAELEQRSIRSVLVAVLKKDPSSPRTRRAFLKTVAEGLAKDLGALQKERNKLPEVSALTEWDLQQALLAEVYWRHVDARGVDFYRADLRQASLRDAVLDGAIFYEADLSGAVLRGASLANANLQGAKLEGADFSDADIENIILIDATFDANTRWPAKFGIEAAQEKRARLVAGNNAKHGD